MAEPPFDVLKAQRWFAIEFNNRAWEIVEATDRSTDDIDQMLHMAHAACIHWRAVGTAINEVRAQVLLASAYALANQPAAATRFADSCLQMCERGGNELTPFDRAGAHGSAANAYAAAGDLVRAKKHYAVAVAAVAECSDPADQLTFDRLFPSPAANLVH